MGRSRACRRASPAPILKGDRVPFGVAVMPNVIRSPLGAAIGVVPAVGRSRMLPHLMNGSSPVKRDLPVTFWDADPIRVHEDVEELTAPNPSALRDLLLGEHGTSKRTSPRRGSPGFARAGRPAVADSRPAAGGYSAAFFLGRGDDPTIDGVEDVADLERIPDFFRPRTSTREKPRPIPGGDALVETSIRSGLRGCRPRWNW